MSLQIICCGRRQVIVCSDSRGVYEFGAARDHFQKLFAAGEMSACGIGGVLELSATDRIADRVLAFCSRQDLRDSPQKLLLAIRDDLFYSIKTLFESELRFKLRADVGEQLFTAFCIKRAPTGEIDFWELCFAPSGESLAEPELNARVENSIPLGPFIYSTGFTGAESVVNHIKPDLSDDELILQSADATFLETTREKLYAGEVGGPVDVIAIDKNGLRWLRKKSPDIDTPSGKLGLRGLIARGRDVLNRILVEYPFIQPPGRSSL